MNQFSRFLVVGLFNTLLGYSVIFACMYLARIVPEISNVAGYAVGLIASYVLNKNYTFNSKTNNPQEMIRFLAVFGIAYVANLAMLSFLIHKIGVSNGLSQIYAGTAYVFVFFAMNKYYVFTNSRSVLITQCRPTFLMRTDHDGEEA
jgi:putative flippase GtrA